MEAHGRQLAGPATPLGLIQRGRGAGYLWAREHPIEARPLLRSCLEQDPRWWDREAREAGGSRAAYYTELARAVGFRAADLKPLLEAHSTPPTWNSDEEEDRDWLPVSVLAGLAFAGDEAARALVLDQIRRSPAWVAILQHLGWAAKEWAHALAYDPGRPWPALPVAVSARLGEQGDGERSLREEHTELFVQFATWPLTLRFVAQLIWSEATGWIDHTREEFEQSQAMTSGHILVRAAKTRDDAAVRALHRVLREDSLISGFAWHALGQDGDRSVLLMALEEIARPRQHDGPLDYLKQLPATTALPIARDFVTRGQHAFTSAGWELLARHAEEADVPLLYAELERALADEEWDAMRIVLWGLHERAADGPFPAARTCFEMTPHSRLRSSAARALDLPEDSALLGGIAYECLWDCEEDVRMLAAGAITRRTREVGHRAEQVLASVFDRMDAHSKATSV